MMHDEQHFTSDYSIWSNKIPTTIYKDIYHSAYSIYKIVRTTNFTRYPWMFIGTDFSSIKLDTITISKESIRDRSRLFSQGNRWLEFQEIPDFFLLYAFWLFS